MPTTVMAIVIAAVLACTSRHAGAVETQMAISSTAIDFGTVNVGSTASAAVTLTNTGGDPFGPINIFGGAPPTAEFDASQNCQSNTLPPGGSCMVTYQFSPSGPGTFTDSSSFTISETASQGDGENFSVNLAGVGFDPNAPTTTSSTTSTTSSTTSTTRPPLGWTPPILIRSVNAATTSLDPPEIAMNARGDAVVVWEESGVIHAAVRAPGGSFAVASPPLSQEGAVRPKAGIDAAGNATVAWTLTGGLGAVQTAVRPAGGSFSGAQDIVPAGNSPQALELAVDAGGRAVAVWRASTLAKSSVRPANGTFGASTDLVPPSIVVYESAMATNAQGDVVAVIRANGTSFPFSAFAWADGGATFLGASDLSNAPSSSPRVAVGAQGDTVAVWRETTLRASIRPAGGTFTPPPGVVILGTGSESDFPSVAVDAAGNAIVLWSEGGIGVMRSTFRPVGGEFGPPQDVPGTTGVTVSRVVFAPDGTAVTAFFQADQIAASVRPAGGAFALATNLSPIDSFASDVELAVDDEGNVLAAWEEQTQDEYSIHARFYDPVPPRLEGLVVPATGRVAQAVDVAVAPADRVGPVSIAWTFGDGGTADTTSASHVYTTPGSYPVSVTATDAVGNQSTHTTTISIALCTSVPDCRAVLAAALPNPGAATGKARRVARRLAALARKVDVHLDKALRATGRKQARHQKRAAAALDRLVTIARKAQSRDRLGVPLAPLEAAVDALRSAAGVTS